MIHCYSVVDFALVHKKFSQFNDVRMPEQLQVLNFSAYLSNDVEIFYLLPVDHLDGHFVTSKLMNSNLKANDEIVEPRS